MIDGAEQSVVGVGHARCFLSKLVKFDLLKRLHHFLNLIEEKSYQYDLEKCFLESDYQNLDLKLKHYL